VIRSPLRAFLLACLFALGAPRSLPAVAVLLEAPEPFVQPLLERMRAVAAEALVESDPNADWVVGVDGAALRLTRISNRRFQAVVTNRGRQFARRDGGATILRPLFSTLQGITRLGYQVGHQGTAGSYAYRLELSAINRAAQILTGRALIHRGPFHAHLEPEGLDRLLRRLDPGPEGFMGPWPAAALYYGRRPFIRYAAATLALLSQEEAVWAAYEGQYLAAMHGVRAKPPGFRALLARFPALSARAYAVPEGATAWSDAEMIRFWIRRSHDGSVGTLAAWLVELIRRHDPEFHADPRWARFREQGLGALGKVHAESAFQPAGR